MGSGLILLVIVAAWLAVLVPMALRSQDNSMSSVDRFSDAMRVLSRREPAAGAARPFVDRPATPVAVRRLRTLLALGGMTGVSLVAGLLGVFAGYLLFVLFAGLGAAYVLHLRRLARRRPQVRRPVPVPVTAVVPAVPARIAGIPDRMPARVTPAAARRASRYEDLPAAAGSGTWDPVPFPVPTYVTAPTAAPRVLDLTKPGEWSARAEAAAAEATATEATATDRDAVRDGQDDGLDGRRASGDW